MMNETATPDISVIVPVYNAEAYLRRCLDSLLAQDFTQWEAICVDDGSRDGSGDLLDEYAAADSRFVVIHQENAGVAAARNRALDTARGKYLVFLDADDWYAPEAMGMYCRALQGGKADIACSAFYQYGNGRAPLLAEPYKHMPVGIVPLEQRNLKFVVCCGWAKAYRRDIVEANDLRFDKGMKLGEDVLFVFRYLAHCRYMALEPAPLYNYLTNEDSAVQQGASGRYPVEVYDMNMRVPVLASDYMRKVVPEWARRREYGYFFLWHALRERNKWSALTRRQPELNRALKRCNLRYVLVLATRTASIPAWRMLVSYFFLNLKYVALGFIRKQR